MKIYISGSITGDADYIQVFARAEAKLLKKGHEVVNPVALSHNHGKTYQEYMKEDIKALLDCDAIYMIPGWCNSAGATFELDVANMCGIERSKDNKKTTVLRCKNWLCANNPNETICFKCGATL